VTERNATGPRAAARLIGSRSFGPYFIGNALSASGGWFHNLAAALLIYRLTHSEFLLGVLTFANFVPTLLLAPWAGTAADRFDRRRLIVASQLVAIAISASLAAVAWSGHASAALVIGASLALGVTTAFGAPAAQALVPSLVPEADVPSAVALNSMTYNIARAAGPTLAAVTVATVGIPAAFAVNAVSYLALALGAVAARPRPSERPDTPPRVRDGLQLLRRDPELLALLVIVAVVGFASDPINTLAPAFAREFDHPDTHAGYIIGVFGAGAVTAALVLAGRTVGSARRLAATLTLLGVGVSLFALSPTWTLGLALLFMGGFGYLASNAAATTRLQLGVAEYERGRIMALWTVAFLGVRPFASLVDGALAAAFGVRVAGVALALPALAAGAFVGLYGRSRTPEVPEPSPETSGAMKG